MNDDPVMSAWQKLLRTDPESAMIVADNFADLATRQGKKAHADADLWAESAVELRAALARFEAKTTARKGKTRHPISPNGM